MNKSILVAYLFFCASLFVNGQTQVWPLSKCLEEGLKNSLEAKIQQLEVKRSQRAKTALLHQWLPTIGLYANHSYNFGSTIDPATNARVSSNIQYDNFALNASINLLDFNSLNAQARSKMEVERTTSERAVFENEYQLQITESYYQALYTQELLKIRENQFINTQANRNRIAKEVAAGLKPTSDNYDIQLAYLAEEKVLLETRQMLENQKLELLQLINTKAINAKELALQIPIIQETLAPSGNPKVIRAKIAHDQAEKNTAAKRAQSLPTLTAFYQFSSFYYRPLNQPLVVDSFSQQMGNNKTQQAGLQLSIPVFNGFRNHKQVAAAKIEVEKAKENWNLEQQKLTNQLQLENQKMEQLIQLHSNLQETVEFARRSFKTSQAKFESGKIEAVTFSAVKNQLMQSEYEVLKNQLMTQFTQAKMNLLQTNSL